MKRRPPTAVPIALTALLEPQLARAVTDSRQRSLTGLRPSRRRVRAGVHARGPLGAAGRRRAAQPSRIFYSYGEPFLAPAVQCCGSPDRVKTVKETRTATQASSADESRCVRT
jgi:hypothetical protein